ncbi:hypothetical protein LSI54_02990 [Nesterenkonia sp. AY15]|uniref:hypothetical protein n=1 Tax=Nesterenkonia sp. AY15 TaxID=2901139 RepID=UPI001F4C9460|nr:hypothetical protein [Nesterenkonia sp. AY15]MCH8570338.1 hypothetical protein [Nesterenkonia sp. AY15]
MMVEEELPEVGDFVDPGPTDGLLIGQARVDYFGLDALAERARQNPGQPMLAAKKIPFRVAKTISARRRDPYFTEDGIVKVTRRSTGEKNEDGEKLVNLWFTYEPFPPR